MKSTRRTGIFVGVALCFLAVAVIAVPALASSGGAFGTLRSANATSTHFAAWRFTRKAATSVTAEFKAPSVKCTSTATGVEPAVAMGTGTPANTEVSSSGVRYVCIGGKLYTLAAVEVDGASLAVTKNVVPGDVIRATVTTSSNTTTATIADTTTGHTFTLTKSGTGGTSFVEDVYDDSVYYGSTQEGVADFGSISFSAAAVSGTALGSGSPAGTAYNMETSKGVLQILTGALTGKAKNAFTTTWKHS
jgi:hypothetical protein